MPVDKPQKSRLQQTLRTLVQSPEAFTIEQAYAALHDILNGQATSGQIASFLTSLRVHKLDHRADIIATCARVLLEQSTPVPLADHGLSSYDVVDIVGTGGDGHDTFNVSTSAGIIVAATGVKVAKHGNRASSSSSGSADMLEALGCSMSAHTPSDSVRLLATTNYAFLFAQRYHPSMAHVAAVRKELGFPTLFNLVGPLVNPVQPKRAVVGVAAAHLGPVMLDALRRGGVERAMVVCGEEGLDEISPAGNTNVWQLLNGEVTEFTVHPRDFGLEVHALDDVRGGNARHNAMILEEILNGERKDAILDYILLNASALLVVAGLAADWKEGVALARATIDTGRARQTLAQFITGTC
ncbi:anthranilate phosphoribosyltransferase [Syncephalis pseudoplumigaleata]|uniref:Anthranilate phosphoribosyltransferase n=1 Tax=Syncephalis pseudoplumigaleata TaxID=1712513 RepID=A0A4P9Z563_9FUNG|nr:anthranilate phosphoribosyltransferase [Syncephalis pseudoplumigaleata]|eukprot:RKP27754.1 anthranilate phosphoribosyltransferase [Syncephalis pseudoplumigaleata]